MQKYFRNTFIAGILTILPLVVTFWLLKVIFNKFTGVFLPYLELLARRLHIYMPVWVEQTISFAIVVFLILFIGFFAKNYVGRYFLTVMESFVDAIPIARGIYRGTKQIVDSFQSSTGTNFRKVVLVEYPRKGVYSLGFVTKDTSTYFTSVIKDECYNVFIPTTPNPTSGFILIVPKKEVATLDIPVEEGIKFIISVGLVTPQSGIASPLPKGRK